jgi:hypothetical protein
VPGCEADGNVRWSNRRALKDIEPGPAPEMLPAVRALEVEHWRYRPAVAEALGLDQAEHIGPMAEDWQAATGLGDGVTINVIDAIGVLTKAVQELAAEVAELRRRLDRAPTSGAGLMTRHLRRGGPSRCGEGQSVRVVAIAIAAASLAGCAQSL